MTFALAAEGWSRWERLAEAAAEEGREAAEVEGGAKGTFATGIGGCGGGP